MKKITKVMLRRLLWDQRGQVLPVSAVMFLGLIGMAGIVLDVGRVFYDYRVLQGSTDSAALAAAGVMVTATSSAQVTAAATKYSSVSGDKNARTSVANVTMVSGYPKLKCLSTLQAQGVACVGAVPYNAVQVKQQAVVPMYIAGMFGHSTMTVTASSTAATRGGSPTPYNVAVIVDTTLSMNYYDADCGATQITCSLNGVQVLLQSLSPCAASLATCTTTNGKSANAVDAVSLFTFPAVSQSTAAIDTNCTVSIPSPTPQNGYGYDPGYGNYVMPPANAWYGVPTAVQYTFPTAGASGYNPSSNVGTYQLTGFLSDYRTSNSATTLNNASALVKAVGGASGCQGIIPTNYDGVYGTYYAGVIYAAQAALVAQQTANPGTQNVLILLSDGNATAPQTNGSYTVIGSPATSNGYYPSWNGECGQAVTAAQYAGGAGTRVYTVGYGSEPVGCLSDINSGSNPNISPCNAMAAMASAPQYWYSDYKQSGSGSTCVASQPITALSQIFASIAADLTTARLIPDSTT